MHRTHGWWLLACFAFAGCGDDDGGGGAPDRREHVTALRGTISASSGAPLAGVRVSSGGATATSRADGKYDLRVGAGHQVVRYEQAGFVTVVAPIDVVAMDPTQRDVAMLALAAA